MTRALSIQTRVGLALVALVACGTSEPTRRTLEPVAQPAGEAPDVFDNPLHSAHLEGVTPVACAACHDLEAAEFVAPGRDRCLECHASNSTAIHGQAILCGECHQFAATSAATPAIECQRCHAEAQGDARMISAHAEINCQGCHRPHGEPSLAVVDCLDCHEDHRQGHGKPGQSTIERCSACHPPHSKAIEAVARCSNCHQDRIRGLRGHDRCEVCHTEGTTSAPPRRRGCTDCHRANAALAATRVAEHRRCESCHSPHDPLGTARQSCLRCHQAVQPAHPRDRARGSCLGCHPAHPKAPERTSRACSSCHRAAGSDTGFHAPPKTRCSDCHRPHGFEAPDCASCHAQQRAEVASGHSRCADCHRQAHRASAPTASCGSCHQTQLRTAPAGHRDCARCHQPHTGDRGSQAECATCHADVVKQIHGRIRGGCESCHRAHGPTGRARPPACATCHQQSNLPNLHAVPEHGQCATCHESHQPKKLDRQTCLSSCHQAQIDHQPVAKTCVGCHPFGGSRR